MSFKNLMQLITLALLSALSITSFAQTDEDDDLLLFLPPIIAGSTNGATFPPEWGLFLDFCCPTSSATFVLTVDGVTKRSVAPSCNSESTFEGFSVSTPGVKSFTGQVSANTCPTFNTNFTLEFENNLRYLVQAELENGQPVLALFVQEITVPSVSSKIENSAANSASSINYVKQMSIPLELESAGTSAKLSSYQAKQKD